MYDRLVLGLPSLRFFGGLLKHIPSEDFAEVGASDYIKDQALIRIYLRILNTENAHNFGIQINRRCDKAIYFNRIKNLICKSIFAVFFLERRDIIVVVFKHLIKPRRNALKRNVLLEIFLRAEFWLVPFVDIAEHPLLIIYLKDSDAVGVIVIRDVIEQVHKRALVLRSAHIKAHVILDMCGVIFLDLRSALYHFAYPLLSLRVYLDSFTALALAYILIASYLFALTYLPYCSAPQIRFSRHTSSTFGMPLKSQ